MNIVVQAPADLSALTPDELRDLATRVEKAADAEILRIQQARLEAIRRERKRAAGAS